MIRKNWESIEKLVAQLTAAEKRELIAMLTASLAEAAIGDEILAEQEQALVELEREMAALRVQNPRDGLSSADHDQILYGKST